jgi:N-methylhydantoinase A
VVDAMLGLGLPLSEVESFVHGTTLGLNAILTRKGARTGIVTNDGFRDILEIARGVVPFAEMYNFQYTPPPRLVPRSRIMGVPGRIDATGKVVEDLDEEAVLHAGRLLVEEQSVRAIAVVFLNSYLNTDHEDRAAAILRANFPGCAISVSTEITREYREYERTSTAMLEAYIRPIFGEYIDGLETDLGGRGFRGSFHVMRSGGGAMTADLAKRAPLYTVLSGPAGGIVGSSRLAKRLDRANIISFDVGGTTIDACVLQGGVPTEIHEADIDTNPILIPIYDIRSIGAGGGSIAWVDEGLLRVGPRSAGADPGPVCYQKGGTEPTVTDAAVCLGYISSHEFLGGEMSIDEAAARSAVMELVARPLGLDLVEAAAAIFKVMLARTVGAIREITVERGLDPRDFTLLAFGGAGPMIAPMLMREMEIHEVVVPHAPSAFSALGMLEADLETAFSKTVLRTLDADLLDALEEDFAELEIRGRSVLSEQHVEADHQHLERGLDLRYLGQEHAIPIGIVRGEGPAPIRKRFDDAHLSRYGHNMNEPVQVATLRLRAIGSVDKPKLEFAILTGDEKLVSAGVRPAYDVASGSIVDFALYDRQRLTVGQKLNGPAIVRDGSSTVVVHGDQYLDVDPLGHLLVAAGGMD